MKKNKLLLGTVILGGFNFFILGLLLLIFSVSSYLNLSPQNWEAFKEVLAEKNLNLDLDLSQFKTGMLFQMVIFFIFALSGLGLLLKKEWARRLTLYFSFFLALIALFSAFFQPSLIRYLFLQIIYPGILIIYFTNKSVEKYFRNQGAEGNKNCPTLPSEGRGGEE